MRTDKHLTIQDYFRRAGVMEGRLAHGRALGRQPQRVSGSFSNALDAAQSELKTQSQGLSIQDYFKHPVHAPQVARIASEEALVADGKGPEMDSGIHDQAKPSNATNAQSANLIPAPEDDAALISRGIEKAAAKYDLSPQLIRAVIKAESNYHVKAVSPAGAQGLMQLMPATAQELGVIDPFDIEQNIDGGAHYLRSMLNRFSGDLKQALSAYNAGPGNVDKYNGQVPFAETRSYVSRVLRFARKFSAKSA